MYTKRDGSKHAVTVTRMHSMRKLFSPARFSGETLFACRHFKKIPSTSGGKMQSVYNGKSVIVVSESTPFCIDYIMKTQRACVSFYIQRYTAVDYPLDSSLQALMNHN